MIAMYVIEKALTTAFHLQYSLLFYAISLQTTWHSLQILKYDLPGHIVLNFDFWSFEFVLRLCSGW